MRVAALVLAAGGSERWGEGSKLLAPWDGGALVEGALRSARDAGLTPLLVVTGSDAAALRRALPDDVRPIPNPDWHRGRATSVAAGIREARRHSDVGAVVILLGDEPLVRPATIRAAVAAWRDEGAALVRTRYRDRPGHPVLVDRSRFDDLVEVEGEAGVARYLERHADEVRTLRVDAPGPADVDTREDYRGLADGGAESRGGRA